MEDTDVRSVRTVNQTFGRQNRKGEEEVDWAKMKKARQEAGYLDEIVWQTQNAEKNRGNKKF